MKGEIGGTFTDPFSHVADSQCPRILSKNSIWKKEDEGERMPGRYLANAIQLIKIISVFHVSTERK